MINYGRRIGLESHEKPAYGTVITNPFHPLSQGEVLHLLMNEGGGNTAYDISGHGNHGTLTNSPVWGGSKFGGGLQLDGGDDYVSVPDDPSLDITEAITISAWVKPKSLPLSGAGSEMMLVGKNAAGCGPYQLFIYHGKIAFLSSNECDWTNEGNNSALSTDVWQHIIVSVEGSTSYYYINGINTDTKVNWNFGNPDTNPLIIGHHDWNGSYFDGSIDSVRIYNRALSAEEIKTLYHNPFCNLIRVPVHRYSVAAAPPPSAIMNQFQKANIGADLYNGAIIA